MGGVRQVDFTGINILDGAIITTFLLTIQLTISIFATTQSIQIERVQFFYPLAFFLSKT